MSVVDSIAELLEQRRWLTNADLVVVEQAYPGAVNSEEIVALRRDNPLLPIVAALGSWCEGESRTGNPWPADGRVYWYEWDLWWTDQIARLTRGKRPDWELPLTASPDERCLDSQQAREVDPEVASGGVLVVTHDEPTFSTLRDALARLGWVAVWYSPGDRLPRVGRLRAVVYDAGQLGRTERQTLQWLAARLEPSRLIALVDFPRPEMLRGITRQDRVYVLGKPYRLGHLRQLLKRP